MYDIFLTEDVHKLVKGKSIVFLGDSNVRAMYKDFLCLLHKSQFIPQRILRNKMEASFYGDELVFHGRRTNGRDYREEREALINSTRVSFYFLTKVFNDYVEEILEKITRRSTPDVIIMNSCVWDITRWGCDGVHHFKDNLNFLMKKFRRLIPNCLIIWVTTPPLAAEMKGGFLVKELQFLKYSLRFHVVEANHFARKVVVENGFDVLDTHFHLQMQIHRRSPDGIHWEPEAVRYVTNLILRHISLSWNVPLPHRYKSAVIDKNLVASEDTSNLNVRKTELKKSSVDLEKMNSEKSVDLEPLGKLQSAVTVVNKQSTSPGMQNKKKSAVTVVNKLNRLTEEQNKKKRRSSIQLYRAPKREEHIYMHMAKAENKARKNRIRKWRRRSLAGSPQFCTPVHNSSKKKLTKNKNGQKPLLASNFSNNTFSISNEHKLKPVTTPRYLLPTPTQNSHQPLLPLITSPSQIPLPPYSPGHQQLHRSHMQSDEPQRPTFNGSNDFNFNMTPSRIPLPPYSPGHPPLDGSPLQRSECQLLPFNRSVHSNFPENVPLQRRVINCQTTCWSSSDFNNYGNRVSSCSQSVFLNRQSPRYNRMLETVNNSVVPYKFPHVASGQNLQPMCDFANDEIPDVYYF